MPKKKEWTKNMHRAQLVAPGEVIQVMDGDNELKCRVLSCLATGDGGCVANVVVIDGARKGERIQGVLKPGTSPWKRIDKDQCK